jgi:hypothetical protein
MMSPVESAPDRVVFERHWRDDFVGEALTVDVAAGALQRMEFYSAEHGIVRWRAGHGFAAPMGWDAPERGPLKAARSALGGGGADRGAIVGAVLAQLPEHPLKPLVLAATLEYGAD